MQRNIEGIADSSVLVLLFEEVTNRSSVWVEAGVALARGVPAVVIGSGRSPLPFLIEYAMGSSTTGLPAWRRINVDLVRAEGPHQDRLARRAAEEITLWANRDKTRS